MRWNERIWRGKSVVTELPSRYLTQRPLDHGSNLIVVDSSRPPGANLVKQIIAAILQKSAAPLTNHVFMVAEFGGHILGSMTAKTGFSHTTIRRMWAAFGLQPQAATAIIATAPIPRPC